ncbi:MAG: glycosyltransferase [Cyanobacteria bacterium]|nr:glycosyltransferase [Cyanobacteriota bacterium]MDW8201225.1 glycosyltransferase [Cyanobacteriota bacterium SKYGB_h_bin112]
MLYPIKVVDVELSQPLVTLEGLEGYMGVLGLVRLHGVPIGYVKAPITNGKCTVESMGQAILQEHSTKLIHSLLEKLLAISALPEKLKLEDLINLPSPLETFWQKQSSYPLVTVAVCTRDRPDDMQLCLSALSKLDYPNLEILVVDNAPTTDSTRNLIEGNYPQVRYVCEPRPGLDWARNRAILEAKGEIIAYTDDDVVVDPLWVKALAWVFVENPQVMAVTGLVVPYELETKAQVLFEHYGGFGRGFEPKWFIGAAAPSKSVASLYGAAGQFGTGANMAFRRSLFEQIGGFDPALDVGTVTNGGGDIEMFFRVLKEGYTLVYTPTAIVRHRHRRDYAKLYTQIANNGIGLYSYFLRSALAYPTERIAFLKLGIWWLWWWLLRRLWISFKYPNRLPRELIWGELRGCFVGLTRYPKANKIAKNLSKAYAGEPLLPAVVTNSAPQSAQYPAQSAIAVKTVELSQPLISLRDVVEYDKARIFVTWHEQPLGSIDIQTAYQPLSASRLRGMIIQKFGLQLLDPDFRLHKDLLWAQSMNTLLQHWLPDAVQKAQPPSLPDHIPVSIVLATYDRPQDLQECLPTLLAQNSNRPIEIIVVDNHPQSGLTPPIVAKFPGVILVTEPRQGLAYARNAGINACTGDIVIATDDDVIAPPDWLEKLVAPFSRPDVMVVTGNVLPIELQTPSQQAFEDYGGLGKGFEPMEVNGDWFESFPRQAVPTWKLGATANAAFRASIFNHPDIGLMEETLGPGLPSGVGEDTYLFYKVLKAGYTLIYAESCYLWHKHRRTEAALRRQLYNYSKGGPSYHLVTWLQDGDWRGLWRILVEIPYLFLWRVQARLRGWTDYPMSLLGLELIGNLAGPWSLWQSHLRVQREGRSSPYIPVAERFNQSKTTNAQPSHQMTHNASAKG